jgi:hypothetical protein
MFYKREDIIVLGGGTKRMNKRELELHIQQIEDLLYVIERMDVSCTSSEIIDLNKYKVISRKDLVKKVLSKPEKSFVFLFNKN